MCYCYLIVIDTFMVLRSPPRTHTTLLLLPFLRCYLRTAALRALHAVTACHCLRTRVLQFAHSCWFIPSFLYASLFYRCIFAQARGSTLLLDATRTGLWVPLCHLSRLLPRLTCTDFLWVRTRGCARFPRCLPTCRLLSVRLFPTFDCVCLPHTPPHTGPRHYTLHTPFSRHILLVRFCPPLRTPPSHVTARISLIIPYLVNSPVRYGLNSVAIHRITRHHHRRIHVHYIILMIVSMMILCYILCTRIALPFPLPI